MKTQLRGNGLKTKSQFQWHIMAQRPHVLTSQNTASVQQNHHPHFNMLRSHMNLTGAVGITFKRFRMVANTTAMSCEHSPILPERQR